MADMYTKLQATRSMVYTGATMADNGVRSNMDTAACFLKASRDAVYLSEECLQLHGGNGYINEYPCGRLWRDAKLYDIGGGTKEVRQWLIGREL
jgi:isovaleryl-CoA dehydrogenase